MYVRRIHIREDKPGKKTRFVTRGLSLMVGLVLSATGLIGRVEAQECADPAPQTSGFHSFRRVGETFDIPIAMDDCQAIALTVRWANGRNNGGLLNLTFFDSENRPLYTKQISAFITGMFEFPLSNVEYQPYGSVLVSSVPALVTVQAAPPFGAPAGLSYTITRVNRRPRKTPPKVRGIDSELISLLQTKPGRSLAEARTYTLTEVQLPEPRELDLPGGPRTVRNVFRLTIKKELATNFGGRGDLIWIDDAAIPVFDSAGGEIAALIYDEALLSHGGELSLSNASGNRLHLLTQRLAYPNGQGSRSRVSSFKEGQPGDVVVAIKNAVRLIGGRRQPLVQIHLRTDRPIPARDSALQFQVGKRFFRDELAGDHSGRMLTLTLTPEMFAELRQGADLVAFFNRPDRSGAANGDIWYFGTLNKSILEQR